MLPDTVKQNGEGPDFCWLRTGDEAFATMIADIDAAQNSVRLEMYIFADCPMGEAFREALIRAIKRGLNVQVLIDAFGSFYLPGTYWAPLQEAGGSMRWFNPMSYDRFGFRDHRKLLVVDERAACVGGFNIAPEYQGDGVNKGWCDLGLRVAGPLAVELARSFDELFQRADMEHPPFTRLRKPLLARRVATRQGILLHGGPGRGFNSFKSFLHRDLARAHSVTIISAYFLPTFRIRRDLRRLARRGVKVRLLLAGKTDVPMSQRACHRLYAMLLRAGIEIYEYQPQVLHAKLIIIDHLVYVGSSNLDIRSLNINYELMVRLHKESLAREAIQLADATLSHCKRIDPATWRQSRSFWTKLRERWDYFLLARVDAYFARRQLRRLR
jgi:cardiolipin synthase